MINFRNFFSTTALFSLFFLIFASSAQAAQNGTTLTTSKTAVGHWEREFNWTIDKSVSPATWDLLKGDEATSEYTVQVTKDQGTDASWIDGQICVTNGGAIATQGLTIVDELTAPPSNTVLNSLNIDLSGNPVLDPGESHCYDYSFSYALIANKTYKNTARISITNHSGHLGENFGPSPSASFATGSGPTLINGTINISDTNGSNWTTSSSNSFSYDEKFICGPDQNGSQTYNNTATIEETGDEDSAEVTVNCFDPHVTKTANTFFDRQFFWDITKTVSTNSAILALNEPYLVDYTVTPNVVNSSDSGWLVTGEITVENNAPLEATINSVSDILSDTTIVTVDCGDIEFPHVLAPVDEEGDEFTCTYTHELSSADSLTNTATAVVQNYSYDSDGVATPIGVTNETGSAAVEFTEPTTLIDDCIDVDDSLQGELGTVCLDDDTTFEYTRDVGSYTQCGARTVENIASFITNTTQTSGQSSASVAVNVPCTLGCTLTIGYWKNHAGFGPQADMLSGLLPKWLGNPAGAVSLNVTSPLIAVNVLTQKTYGAPSNGITKLYAQLLAAKLNIQSGASPVPVMSVITNADNYLSNKSWTSWSSLNKANQQQILSWQGALDAYNNGLTSVPHCSE